MNEIESWDLVRANFQHVTNPIWKHAPRVPESQNNLLFVTDGVLYIEMQNVQYTVNPGEFLFLPHGVISIGYRPSGVPTGYYFIIFKANKPVDIPLHFTVPDTNTVRDLCAHLVKTYFNPDYPRAGVNALLHALFYEIQYQLDHTDPQTDSSLAVSIKKYLRDTVFRNMTVHDVAAHFGFCPDYINRIFSRAEHITVKAYINKLKIRRIEEYLVSTNTPIKDIAKKLNFSTPSALSKFYKYHTGQTPEEYRSKYIK